MKLTLKKQPILIRIFVFPYFRLTLSSKCIVPKEIMPTSILSSLSSRQTHFVRHSKQHCFFPRLQRSNPKTPEYKNKHFLLFRKMQRFKTTLLLTDKIYFKIYKCTQNNNGMIIKAIWFSCPSSTCLPNPIVT